MMVVKICIRKLIRLRMRVKMLVNSSSRKLDSKALNFLTFFSHSFLFFLP